jgi:hypothetical protein
MENSEYAMILSEGVEHWNSCGRRDAGKKVNCHQTHAIAFCIEWVTYFLASIAGDKKWGIH